MPNCVAVLLPEQEHKDIYNCADSYQAEPEYKIPK